MLEMYLGYLSGVRDGKKIIFSEKVYTGAFLHIIHACINLLFPGKMDLFD